MIFGMRKINMLTLTKYILNLLLLLVTFCSVEAQTSAECRELVRKSYANINVSDYSKRRNEAMLLRYTTKIIMWNNDEVPNSETEVKLITAKKQIIFLTKDASFYSDDKDVFLVVPKTLDLIRSKAVMSEDKDNFFIKQASLLKDSLIMKSSVKNCSDVTLDGTVLKKIELEPPLKAKKFYSIERMIFFIDTKTANIKKYKVLYSKASQVKEIENTYYDINTHYKTDTSLPVYYKFFDKKDRLQAQYKNYHYVDNTK
jgi:hypothetical protein